MTAGDAEASIEARYRGIQARIARAARQAGRDPASVRLIAVSKKQPVARIQALYALGHRDFGENYVQELIEKARELEGQGGPGIRWHFIGHLQTNKAKALVPHLYCIHSVDSDRVATELARQWRAQRGSDAGHLPIFIEVNLSAEPTKSGLAPAAVLPLAHGLEKGAPALALQGLMCIPESTEPPEKLRARFAELRELERSLKPHSRGMLSMGMSHDFEPAILEGATHIRVGTALFGPRE